jgi:hypothetical protein
MMTKQSKIDTYKEVIGLLIKDDNKLTDRLTIDLREIMTKQERMIRRMNRSYDDTKNEKGSKNGAVSEHSENKLTNNTS